MRKILIVVFLLNYSASYSQDTIINYIANRRDVHYSHLPPNFQYSASPYGNDTIFYYKYLTFNQIYRIVYINSGIENVWIAYYPNGVIMEMGGFKSRGRRKELNRAKDGIWLYFSKNGTLVKRINHINEPYW